MLIAGYSENRESAIPCLLTRGTLKIHIMILDVNIVLLYQMQTTFPHKLVSGNYTHSNLFLSWMHLGNDCHVTEMPESIENVIEDHSQVEFFECSI